LKRISYRRKAICSQSSQVQHGRGTRDEVRHVNQPNVMDLQEKSLAKVEPNRNGFRHHADDQIRNGKTYYEESKGRPEAFVRVFEHSKADQEIARDGDNGEK